MAARSIATASISFGLVTVPVRIYPAVRAAAGLSFHLLHAKDDVRLKQQYVCPKDDEVVPRSEMVKGFEYKKDRYVVFTDEELKALDEQATSGIEITEFLPRDAVDPVYLERTYYLGPDKGGEKGYGLLAQAMAQIEEVALARYAARGKSYLVLVRSTGDHLFMHQLYHSDEVRKRVEKLIQQKLKGKDITVHKAEERPPAEVVDLMEALKASLARKGAGARKAAPRAAAGRPARLRAVAGRKK